MSFSDEINENAEVENTEAENTENTAAEYSVFSDPAHFKEEKREKVSKHPMFYRILAAVLAVAVIGGGTFAAVKLIPKPIEETDNTDTSVPVLNLSAPIDSVEIKNEITTLKFISRTTENGKNSELTWSIEGINSEYTQSSSISNLVNSIAGLSALQKIPAEDGADYGFDEPNVRADISAGNEKVTLSFGDVAPANIGIYCKASNNNEDVFVVSLTAVMSLQVVPTDFANAPGYSGVEVNAINKNCFSDDGNVVDFDFLEISGKKYEKPIKVVMQEDEAVNACFAFKVESPMECIGDNDKPQEVLNLFAKGFSAEGAYAFDPTDAHLEKYNLKEPDIICKAGFMGETYTLRFGIIDDTYCAFLNEDGKMIQKVPITSVPFLNYVATDYYSSFIVLENLSGLKGLKIDTAENSVSFDLEYTKGEDTKSDVYKAFYGGKELDITSFKNYYQTIIGMTPISYETGISKKPDMKITFIHSSDLGDTVLEFTQYSAQRYQVNINGTPLGLITKTVYDTFLSDTAKICAGEKI